MQVCSSSDYQDYGIIVTSFLFWPEVWAVCTILNTSYHPSSYNHTESKLWEPEERWRPFPEFISSACSVALTDACSVRLIISLELLEFKSPCQLLPSEAFCLYCFLSLFSKTATYTTTYIIPTLLLSYYVHIKLKLQHVYPGPKQELGKPLTCVRGVWENIRGLWVLAHECFHSLKPRVYRWPWKEKNTRLRNFSVIWFSNIH